MKKIKLLLPLLVLILTLSFSFLISKPVSAATIVDRPTTDEEKVNRSLENISIRSKAIASFPVTYKSGLGTTITWTSSDNSVIDATHVNETNGWVIVHRSAEVDQTAELTVTVSLNGISDYKTVEVAVPKGTTNTKTYNVTYKNVDGLENANPATHKAGQLVELQSVTKANYIFKGWYSDEALTKEITYLPVGIYSDINVYAKFEEVVLQSIEVSGEFKKVYDALESFDKTGMVVTAKYSDGTSKEVEGYTVDKTVLHGNDTKVVVTYQDKTADVEITVKKVVLNTPVVNAKYSFVYDGLAHSVAIVADEKIEVSYEGTNSLTDKGTKDVTVKFALSAENQVDYVLDAESKATVLEVTAKPITVTADNKSSVYGASLAELTYSVTSGEKVATDELEFTLTKEEGLNAGSYVISIAKKAEYPNYDITLVNGTYIISKAPLTVSPQTVTVNRGATLPATVELLFEGFVNEETKAVLGGELVISWGVENTNTAGTFEYEVSGYTSDNYEISYNKGSLLINESTVVIEIAEENLTTVYNGEVQKIATSNIVFKDGENVVSVSNVTVEYKQESVTIENPTNAGTYSVLVSFSDTTYGTGSQSFVYKITPKAASITIESHSKVYTGAALTPDQTKVTVDGLVNENDLGTVSLVLEAKAINAGVYNLSASYTANTNYTVTVTKDAKFTIEKADSVITAEDIEVTYDGLVHNVVATLNHLEAELSYENNGKTSAGTYTVTVSVLESENYKAASKEVTLTINKKDVTVTIQAQEAVYTGTEPTVNQTMFSASGVVGEDNLGVTLTKEAGVVVKSYKITGAATNANYNVTFVPGSFKITKAELRLTIDNKTIKKGEAFPEFTYTLTGFVNGEDSSVVTITNISYGVYNGETEIVAADTVGTYTITADTADFNYTADNYTIEIVKGTLTVELSDAEKVDADYDALIEDYSSVLTGTITDIPTLPVSGTNGSKITWTAQNSDILSINPTTGVVEITKGENKTEVIILTAEVQINNEVRTYTFEFTFNFAPKGSIDNPYTADEAIAIIKNFDFTSATTEKYYVKGIVKTTSTNKTFNIASSLESSNELMIYNPSASSTVGHTVVVYGSFQNFKGNTPEISGAPVIISDEFMDEEKLALDLAEISLPTTLSENTTFPVALTNGSAVAYTSGNPEVLSIAGGNVTINRPAAGSEDVVVTVSYVVTLNGLTSEGHSATITVKAESAVKELVITYEKLNITGSYKDYSKTVDGVNIMAKSVMKNYESIQGNSNKSSYIYNVSALSGKIVSIEIKFSTSGRSINIYGSDSVLSNKGDGTKIDTCSDNKVITFTGEYTYFQIEYSGGASYISEITITYDC